MRLQFVIVQYSVYRGTANAPKTGMAGFGSMLRDIPGQRGNRPKFRRQTQILGLGTSDGHHPFTCFLADLGCPGR